MRIELLFVAILGLAFEVSAGLPSGWTDDFKAAKARAVAEDKKVLLVFTGSDWCGWCKKFDEDTLSKPDFIEPASRKFVLVMIDSPKDKSILSAVARTRNLRLVSQYGIRGYPHVLLTDAVGREIARSAGYVKGGPKAFLAKLDEMAGASSGPKEREQAQPDGMTCRQVACWTVCAEDAALVTNVNETADFLAEILKAFDDETASYYRTMPSHFDGILVHRNLSMRGKRERFVKGKCYLNLYAPDTLRTQSWCGLFCGGFLSRCKKEPLPDKEREAMLLHVGANVSKKMGIGGGDRYLARIAGEPVGMGRILHELCTTNNAAIRRYYAAKIQLSETDRFGPFLGLSDMAEVFSAAAGCDAFPIFRQYGKRVRKEEVSAKLRGFADEPFRDERDLPKPDASGACVVK